LRELRQDGPLETQDDSERDIPVSDVLLKDLLALKRSGFLFATPDAKVDGHLDRDLGTVAKLAKVPNAKLHRFRDTFITNKIRDGVDIRTVQKYAGHTDVNVTMSYADWLDDRSKKARD
jgi:integrase